MPRLMSVALTVPQVEDRTKTVTRRDGWRMLKPGDRLTLCRKVQGRKRGEPLVRLAEVEVVHVDREALHRIRQPDVDREGFPDRDADWFIDMFCATHKGCTSDTVVTRIEWKYLDNETERSN